MTITADQSKRFTGDFTKFLNWALIWILLSNIAFMAMWPVGAPPRFIPIALAGFVGLIVKRMPHPVQWLAFVAVMIFSTLSFVSGLFSLTLDSLIYSLQFFSEIKPGNSIEYLAAAAVVFGILVGSWFLLKRDSNFAKPLHILYAGAAIFSLIAVDAAIGEGMRGHYFRAAPAGAEFESAVTKSGFAARADGKRNLILIIVESLGVPKNNRAMSAKLFAMYKHSSAVTARYSLKQGTSLYYNSTTAGEMRELCGRWGDYYELLETSDPKKLDCLPAQLAKKGYGTQAMHSFQGPFFKRETWYPKIGFQKREFAPELEKRGAELCGGVFAGSCDRQIPALLAENVKKAKQPVFQYWLTLNSHLPVPTEQNLHSENCERVSPELASDFPMICRQFAIFDDIDAALIAQITAKDFPESDILIVGDHMPPYFDRHHRSQYDPEHVPWLYLQAKDQAQPKG